MESGKASHLWVQSPSPSPSCSFMTCAPGCHSVYATGLWPWSRWRLCFPVVSGHNKTQNQAVNVFAQFLTYGQNDTHHVSNNSMIHLLILAPIQTWANYGPRARYSLLPFLIWWAGQGMVKTDVNSSVSCITTDRL